MKKHMQIAHTIFDQIRHSYTEEGTSGMNCVMCWGLTKPMAIDEGYHKDHFAGLQFKVTGALFRGKVRVMLHYSDTYTIYTASPRGKEWTKLEGNIYADQLAAILDNHIERKIYGDSEVVA